MTYAEIQERLRNCNRSEVARATNLKYRYLRRLIEPTKTIQDPGSKRLDVLRDYFLSQDLKK
jgi:hypothetical protein